MPRRRTAWLGCLPTIWNRYTGIARGLQGPQEDRTLTQLRKDLPQCPDVPGSDQQVGVRSGRNGPVQGLGEPVHVLGDSSWRSGSRDSIEPR